MTVMATASSRKLGSSLNQMMSNVVITGGTFIQQNMDTRNIRSQGTKDGFERLLDAVAPAAFHNSAERTNASTCHPNTRVEFMGKVMDWILRLDPETHDALVMWVRGAAGGGKSTIAQTLAERCKEEGLLLASFFFSRSDPSRNHARALCSTLAYQLAVAFPECREGVVSGIDRDPLIFARSLSVQFKSLINDPIQPLITSRILSDPHTRRLIIIDGLDECVDRQVQCQILDVIFDSVKRQQSPLLFLICSRPEYEISTYLNSQNIKSNLTKLVLDWRYNPKEDITLFLEEKFRDIVENHPLRESLPAMWPTYDIIQLLVHKSSGQFIYASTVIKFLSSIRHQPAQRLNIILNLQPSEADSPFSDLDALYTHILSNTGNVKQILDVIGFSLLGQPNSLPRDLSQKLFGLPKPRGPGNEFVDLINIRLSSIEWILGLSYENTEILFCDLHSLVNLETWRMPSHDGSHSKAEAKVHVSLRFQHASFVDFLTDPSRSLQFYLDLSAKKSNLVSRCISKLTEWTNKAANTTEYLRPWDRNIIAFMMASLTAIPPTDAALADVRQLLLPFIIDKCAVPWAQYMEYEAIFLSWIRSSTSETGQEAYLHHLKVLDAFLVQNFDIQAPNMCLTLSAALMCLTPKKQSQISTIAHITEFQGQWEKLSMWVDVYHFNCSSDLSLNRDKLWLKIHGNHVWKPYLSFVSEFLEDPRRSGKYAMNGDRYAEAALCCVTFLCSHLDPAPTDERKRRDPGNSLPCLHVWVDQYLSKERFGRHTSPWLWRRKFIKHFRETTSISRGYVDRSTAGGAFPWKIETAKMVYPPSIKRGHCISLPVVEEMDFLKHYRTMFQYLPRLLKRSARSEELIQYASRRVFDPRSRAFPKEAKRARRAIDQYLARMEGVKTGFRDDD